MTPAVKASYAHCRGVARRAASSFYLSFFLLPAAQRQAMCALYAFLRRTDDLADSAAPVAERRAALDDWRAQLDAALRGNGSGAMWPALADVAVRYQIPARLLHEAIDGAQMDLDVLRYRTFGDLARYCHCAASVVGLACLRIWGCRDERADALACQCGLAFQLTNILRDVAEDARRGRIYLPQEDLARFGCNESQITGAQCDSNFARLMQFEVARAEALYAEASALEPLLPRDGRRAWRVMTISYREILREIECRDYNVFGPPIRFSRWRRVRLAARGLVGQQPAVVPPLRARELSVAATQRRSA
jgi:phytoene synthase